MKKITQLLLIAMVFTGCSIQKQTKQYDKPKETTHIFATSTENKPTIKEKNTIEITSNGFLPNSYTIRVGTTVKWINNDNAPHIIRFLDKFQSPVLKNGETYKYTFNDPGEYFFDCAIHTYLKGKIIVEK